MSFEPRLIHSDDDADEFTLDAELSNLGQQLSAAAQKLSDRYPAPADRMLFAESPGGRLEAAGSAQSDRGAAKESRVALPRRPLRLRDWAAVALVAVGLGAFALRSGEAPRDQQIASHISSTPQQPPADLDEPARLFEQLSDSEREGLLDLWESESPQVASISI